MSFVLIIAKALATIFLSAFFIGGILRANPRTHKHGAAAEYLTGFLACCGSVIGFYYLWIA